MSGRTFLAGFGVSLAGGVLVLAGAPGVAQAAPGTWQDPSGGWQAVYTASGGLYPSQLDGTGTNKPWANRNGVRPTSYTGDGYILGSDGGGNDWAMLANDAVSGEQALQLNHPTGSPVGVFTLDTPPGSGTASDLMTIDYRLRQLSNLATTDPRTSNRFSIYVEFSRPPNPTQMAASGDTADEQFFQIRYRENNLFILGATTAAATVTVSWASTNQLDRAWHDYRVLWDASGGAQFFMDGSSTPLGFTGTGVTGTVTTIYPRVNTTIAPGLQVNQVDFGDQGVTDQASLAYIKVTSSEFAAVVSPNFAWNVDQDGNWSLGTNWNPNTAPNAAGAVANFGTIITAARTVTVDAAQTIGQINFSSPLTYTVSGSSTVTLDGGTGTTSINVTAGSHVIDAPIVLAKDTAVSVSGGGDLSVQHVRGAGLSVSGGTMKITAKGTANDASGTSKLTALTVASGAALDLTNNGLIVDYTTVGTLLDDTRLMLQSGKLTSSSAGGKLGYADNAILHLTSFAGQTVDDGNLLVKFTYGGDANLDGQVDISDLGALATAWQTSAPWTGGDFDYSGFVDISDLGLLATNWQLGVGSPLGPSFDEALASVGLAGVSVPEPTMLGLALLGAWSLKRPRHSIANRKSKFQNS